MSLGGLGARAAVLKNQKPTKKCERCGLKYVAEDNERCPHCAQLSDAELQEFLAARREGNKKLGTYFVFAAVLLALLMIFLFLP